MALTEAYAGTATITSTEWSLPANSATLATLTDVGVFQAVLDLSALTATERYQLTVYEKTRGTSTKRVLRTYQLSGVQAEPNHITVPMALVNGWDITLKLLQGTARSIDWSIRKAA